MSHDKAQSAAEEEAIAAEEKEFVREHKAEINAAINRVGHPSFAMAASGPKPAGDLTVTSRLLTFSHPTSGAYDVVFSIIVTNAEGRRLIKYTGGLPEIIAAFGPSHKGLIETNGAFFTMLMETVEVELNMTSSRGPVVGYRLAGDIGTIYVPLPTTAFIRAS